MRCPSCNKFPALSAGDPEVDSMDVLQGQVTGSVRLVLNSECCGDEVKENNFDIDVDVSAEIIDALKAAGVEEPNLEDDGVEMDVEDEGAEAFDRYENKDRRGKPIRNSRYMKHYYGVSVGFTVKVKYPTAGGGAPIEVEVKGEFKDEVQASGMEELT